MARHDLTDWVIHFVHRRNSENDPLEMFYDPETDERYSIPDGFTYDGKPIHLLNMYEEEDYGLAPDDDAYSVLEKILHDGYIRAGWSYRKFTPTIYGPKAAVCFTEMPLYGLIEYAKTRVAQEQEYVGQYGIAFLKKELFEVGARPVIYGLSTPHREASTGDPYHCKGLRTLASECGLGLREQYRYVYTNMGATRRIDWTHEREWRWADLDQSFEFPGLPFLAQNDKVHFSKMIVIVPTKEEGEMVLDRLKNQHHSKMTNYGREYDLRALENTYVLALDELASITKDPNLVKLDDLPLNSIPKIRKTVVRPEVLEKVKTALDQANKIYKEASQNYADKYGDKYGSGFSYVTTWDANSEITQALVDLGRADTFAKGYYQLNGFERPSQHALGIHEAGAKAAAAFLTTELGQDFYYRSVWD